MTRREQSSAGSSMFAPVLSMATGLLIFIILIIFAPTIAGAIEASQPDLAADSDWNVSHNSALPSGASQWTQNIQILSVIVLIISIAISMMYLRGMS